MVRKFCPYCNREVGPDNQPFGDPIPKDQQAGTHGICQVCFPTVMGEIKPWDFRGYANRRDKNNGKRV